MKQHDDSYTLVDKIETDDAIRDGYHHQGKAEI